MAAVLTHSPERLTWEKITEKYPNAWVGLKDIKFENDDGTNIETAIVSETGTRNELYDSLFDHKLEMVMHTNPEAFALYNWATWPVDPDDWKI